MNKAVFFAAALPPPLHGQSVVTRAILEKLIDSGRIVKTFDLSPGSLNRNSAYYHLTRVRRIILTAKALLTATDIGTAYFVYESGYGILYNFLLCLLARFRGIHVILHHHTSAHTIEYTKKFALVSVILGQNATNVVLSPKMGSDLLSKYKTAPIQVCSNASFVVGSEAHQLGEKKKEPFTLGMLANLTFEKGVRDAVCVARKLNSNAIRCKLLLAGPIVGEQVSEYLRAAVENSDGTIVLCGSLDREAKARFYKSIDAFLFPTHYRFEAQPLVLLEAMSYGRPVISTSQGYISELIEGGGIIVDQRDAFIDDAVTAITRWTKDPEAYLHACSLARAQFKSVKNESSSQQQGLLNLFKRPLFS